LRRKKKLARRESKISEEFRRRFRWRGVQSFDSIPTIMKRWAVLTVLLYAFALVLLTVPVLLAAFGHGGKTMTATPIYRMR